MDAFAGECVALLGMMRENASPTALPSHADHRFFGGRMINTA